MSLIAHWPLNETGGVDAVDILGGNDGAWNSGELVTDSGFDDDTKWGNHGSGGWLVNDGASSKAVRDGSASPSSITQSLSVIAGREYTVGFEVDATDGAVRIDMGGGDASGVGDYTTDTGTYSQIVKASGTTFYVTGNTLVSCTLDDVSCKQNIFNDGRGIVFNGTSEVIEVADNAALDVTAITMSAFIKINTSHTVAGMVISKMDDWSGDSDASYIMYVDSSEGVVLGISDDGTDSSVEISTIKLTIGQWHHIATTYETGTYKIYIDGVLSPSSGTGDASGTINVGTGRVGIGARYEDDDSDFDFWFNGAISDVRIYDTVLTSAQVKALYRSSFGYRARYSNMKGTPPLSMRQRFNRQNK